MDATNNKPLKKTDTFTTICPACGSEEIEGTTEEYYDFKCTLCGDKW